MSQTSTIYFYGGAGTVTGSNFLVDIGDTKILIDCGLSQGRHNAEEINWGPFPYEPGSIPFLFVTHAHIDHIGKIPKLVKDGFKGRIISTEATRALAEPLLLDSQELLAHDARKHNHEMLYDEHDIARAMELWEGVGYHQKVDLPSDCTAEFINSGHILGSALVRFERGGKNLVFTGDLGGGNSPLLPHAEVLEGAQYLVMESVYGDRVRGKDEDRRQLLEDTIENSVTRGGTLLIPAFSTERTQDLLFEIRTLMVEKRVPSVPVYIDSPLASKITAAFLAHPSYFSSDIQARIEGGENIFEFPELTFVETIEESKRVAGLPGPKIVIAGSGMSNGGRVHGYQKYILPDAKSTLLIVGYQSAGSLGRRLIEGEKNVFLMGEKTPVKCTVEAIYGYSAHMDGEQLLEFVNKTTPSLSQVFVVMGEPSSASFLVQRIRDYLGVKATAPETGEKVQIDF
ncbi:MAG: metallo-beta-lactamase family protein [Parcubacteria group bacterium Gr01-1014_56]|nr:MAG: metallo-beta-lactamase family protein [Parcubacteria group bacterium Gr01-1014_56]